jgi:hypothetical protein
MAWENDWPRMRLATFMLIPLPIAIFFQLVRFSDGVQWSNLALWVFLIDATGLAMLCVRLWLIPPATAKV